MKRMTYKTLMSKIEDGYAEVWAWVKEEENGEGIADVIFYKSNGTSTRQTVVVTKMPAESER